MRFAINGGCTRTCSLNEVNLAGYGGDVHQLYEDGGNRETIQAFLMERGVRVSTGAIGRHKQKHLDPMVVAPRGSDEPDRPREKKSHIQILEEIISAGGAQLDTKGVRISPEMTMKAIEMHHKLTEGSVWEDFLSAIGAMAEDAPAPPENPDASQSEDEQAQVAPDE